VRPASRSAGSTLGSNNTAGTPAKTTPPGIGGITGTGIKAANCATKEASAALMRLLPLTSPAKIGSVKIEPAKPLSIRAAKRATCEASAAFTRRLPETSLK